jgi:uncharacterized protein YjbI with pentapeptide repeats
MSPQVTAAIIAAGVGLLTVIATVAVQISGRRLTSQDTQKALAQQREQLDKTLAAQREQLDTTLAEQRTRTFNERFATAAGQLGSDKPPEVRLAGVYAMAGLADDWEDNRQTCVDVLCAYLRMPYEPDPGDEAPVPKRLAFRASREVRHTVIRVITAHLREGAAVSWRGRNLDFTGVVFDGGDFSGAEFSGGEVTFSGAEFSDGEVTFHHAKFSGSRVIFYGARFSGGVVSFFDAGFSGGMVRFFDAKFCGSEIIFHSARFSGGTVSFIDAKFSGGKVHFYNAKFSGGRVFFGSAELSGSVASVKGPEFSGTEVSFYGAEFSGCEVNFSNARFSGGEVDFSQVGDWSFPPAFPWTGTPPPGVMLPVKHDQSHAPSTTPPRPGPAPPGVGHQAGPGTTARPRCDEQQQQTP